MKKFVNILSIYFLLFIDILVVNDCINKVFSKWFDLLVFFTPLVYLVIYIKPGLIMAVSNRIYLKSDSRKNKIISICISLILYVLSAVIYSKVLLANADFFILELWIHIVVSIVSAGILICLYRGDR